MSDDHHFVVPALPPHVTRGRRRDSLLGRGDGSGGHSARSPYSSSQSARPPSARWPWSPQTPSTPQPRRISYYDPQPQDMGPYWGGNGGGYPTPSGSSRHREDLIYHPGTPESVRHVYENLRTRHRSESTFSWSEPMARGSKRIDRHPPYQHPRRPIDPFAALRALGGRPLTQEDVIWLMAASPDARSADRGSVRPAHRRSNNGSQRETDSVEPGAGNVAQEQSNEEDEDDLGGLGAMDHSAGDLPPLDDLPPDEEADEEEETPPTPPLASEASQLSQAVSRPIPSQSVKYLEGWFLTRSQTARIPAQVLQRRPDAAALKQWIYVEGFKREDEDRVQWHSTPIAVRREAHLVETQTGSLYGLVGPADRHRTRQQGLSARTAEAFSKGFPDDWIDVLVDDLLGLEDVDGREVATPKRIGKAKTNRTPAQSQRRQQQQKPQLRNKPTPARRGDVFDASDDTGPDLVPSEDEPNELADDLNGTSPMMGTESDEDYNEGEGEDIDLSDDELDSPLPAVAAQTAQKRRGVLSKAKQTPTKRVRIAVPAGEPDRTEASSMQPDEARSTTPSTSPKQSPPVRRSPRRRASSVRGRPGSGATGRRPASSSSSSLPQPTQQSQSQPQKRSAPPSSTSKNSRSNRNSGSGSTMVTITATTTTRVKNVRGVERELMRLGMSPFGYMRTVKDAIRDASQQGAGSPSQSQPNAQSSQGPRKTTTSTKKWLSPAQKRRKAREESDDSWDEAEEEQREKRASQSKAARGRVSTGSQSQTKSKPKASASSQATLSQRLGDDESDEEPTQQPRAAGQRTPRSGRKRIAIPDSTSPEHEEGATLQSPATKRAKRVVASSDDEYDEDGETEFDDAEEWDRSEP